MTTTKFANNPYLVEHSQAIDLTEPLSPWAPTVIPAANYRVKALTKRHLEQLCRIAYQHIEYEATKYEGSRVTDELATEMATDVGEAIETLRLALITHAIAEKQSAEHLRAMDLTAVKKYFEKHIGKVRR